jgi:hypothetical protein
MLGIIKGSEKLPFFLLDKFVDLELLDLCRQELENYVVQQSEGAEIFVGYNGSDWQNHSFQQRQQAALPKTVKYISSFCDFLPEFNIRYAEKGQYYTVLHQDIAPFSCQPRFALKDNYKENLHNGLREKIKDSEDFVLVSNVGDVKEKFQGLDFDHETFLKSSLGDEYLSEIKGTYKLHMVISKEKTMFIYDNVEDKIYDIDGVVCVFNPRDFHDTRLESWGISIQFPMHTKFLRSDIKKELDLL